MRGGARARTVRAARRLVARRLGRTFRTRRAHGAQALALFGRQELGQCRLIRRLMLLMGLMQQRPELTGLLRVQGQRVLQMLLVLRRRQLRRLRGFRRRAAAPGGGPVSYTHLTLPTIYSV